jgi:PTH1 family peptidyl-tRNA hydrolase
MNRSGAAIAPLLDLPGFDPSRDLLVLVDEVALPLGRFRLRGAGSAGGHNGLKSVEGVLRRQDYARLRIGVGRGDMRRDLADHVLARFEPDERPGVEGAVDRAADAVEQWVRHGIDDVMNVYNRADE